jgi:hypothetical protein
MPAVIAAVAGRKIRYAFTWPFSTPSDAEKRYYEQGAELEGPSICEGILVDCHQDTMPFHTILLKGPKLN